MISHCDQIGSDQQTISTLWQLTHGMDLAHWAHLEGVFEFLLTDVRHEVFGFMSDKGKEFEYRFVYSHKIQLIIKSKKDNPVKNNQTDQIVSTNTPDAVPQPSR